MWRLNERNRKVLKAIPNVIENPIHLQVDRSQ